MPSHLRHYSVEARAASLYGGGCKERDGRSAGLRGVPVKQRRFTSFSSASSGASILAYPYIDGYVSVLESTNRGNHGSWAWRVTGVGPGAPVRSTMDCSATVC